MMSDVIIIGAGAAGMMCALQAGTRGRSVLLIEHSAKLGEKIRISGGGRCNFTNVHTSPEHFFSRNPGFCRSALSRFTPQDFIALVEKHGIATHEKKLGQLFCDGSSRQIIAMLKRECNDAGVRWQMPCRVKRVSRVNPADRDAPFTLTTDQGVFTAPSLVIATGGLSIPQIGATPFGHRVAEQFGLGVTTLRPALVPLKLDPRDLARFGDLSGVSIEVEASCGKANFRENLLFTHWGLSGPAILQISSAWREGEEIRINVLPSRDPYPVLTAERERPILPSTLLSRHVPKRFAQAWCEAFGWTRPLNQMSAKELLAMAAALNAWRIIPIGTMGYEKAEVTLGGVDTDELSSKTMEAKKVPGLYFIGEVVDVTGQLGGFNFQWAWASGYAAGQAI